MGFRETYGQMVEDALNVAVDKYLNGEEIKAKLNEEVNKLIDGKLEDLKHQLKAEVIDKIDGEDDIQ